MAKRCLDSVAAAMQQHQRQLSRIRRTVDFIIHPKAVDRRVSSLLECAGVHGGETTIAHVKAFIAFTYASWRAGCQTCANCASARTSAAIGHSPATGLTSTRMPYGKPGHSFAIAIASSIVATSRRK